MEHIVRFRQGHDCIKFQCAFGSDRCIPGEGGSHGVHGLEIVFAAKGDMGAITFLLYTGWLPQYATTSDIGVRDVFDWGGRAMPCDLGYHSKTKMYEDQLVSQEKCEYCDGLTCYSDGSGLQANDAMYALVNGGDDALWAFLDGYYDAVFNGAKYPKPAEYEKQIRQKLYKVKLVKTN